MVGVDLYGLAAAERFAAQHAPPPRTLRPAEFLASLPSTPAGTLGLLFGLHAYQATLCHPELAALQALQHACDVLERGVLRRVLLVALSAVEPEVQRRWQGDPGGDAAWLAVALALEVDRGALRVRRVTLGGAEDRGESAGGPLLADLAPSYRGLPAASLLALARADAPAGLSWGAGRIELAEGGRA